MDNREVAGVRRAITWLHERGKTKNDPQAKAILDSAAFNLGVALSNWRCGNWHPSELSAFPRGTRVRITGEDFTYVGRVLMPIEKLDGGPLRYAIQDDNRRLFFQNPKQVSLPEDDGGSGSD